MPAPETIVKLVAKFEANRESYRSGKYNEAQLRLEFLDPFFAALGWDVTNRADYAPENREVVIEESTDVEGSSKSPDYAFKLGHEVKFYVEAKKPKVDIQYDIHPAYQLKRYAWNKRLPLSILTDFEEFAIYNCKAKPNPGDSAATGRDQFYRYTEYIEKWDEIAGIFSREAVWKGAFDRFAETTRGKKGTTEVDDEILKDIEEWRLKLARNIALRNPQIADEAQLNYAVQMTIDRILFLRICEDRGIEPEGQLQALAQSTNIYPALVGLFKQADQKYNSGLFHFGKEKANDSPADAFTPTLSIDDRVLKEIITSIYYPCPYIFREIPVEILGQVYEQFLGKVIRLTPGHQAKIEEKPEVRKAGGVYYTPQYIVDYIVKNTVGSLLEGKTPAEAAELKIVDPACGSGSFLLGAYQYLLDWHLDWYTAHEPERWGRAKNPPVLPAAKGEWKLTTAKRKEILLNSLHGVDIDAQAVEVTKLSLLLKVLEGETGQMGLGFERALPDLGRNIQCGNSLIGEDYFAGQLVVDEAERRRVNPFEWRRAFPQVFARGGFDAVIGNPPYGGWLTTEENIYLSKNYEVFSRVKDIYISFIEKGVNLLKKTGLFSFIVPSAWIGGPQYIDLRKFMLSYHFEKLVLLPFDVFSDAYIDTLIFVISKIEFEQNHLVSCFVYPKKEKISSMRVEASTYTQIDQDTWIRNQNQKIILNSGAIQLLEHIQEFCPRKFEDVIKIKRGVLFDKKILCQSRLTPRHYKYFEGDVYRYEINEITENWVEFGDKMTERPKEIWWFEGERILLRRLVNRRQRLMAVFTDNTYITNKNLYSIKGDAENLLVILGILNSKLISYLYIHQVSQATKDDFPQVTIKDILSLPLPSTERIKAIENRLISQVRGLQFLVNRAKTSSVPSEVSILNRQIDACDREIDNLVYLLYSLTDEEIKIVEG